MKKIIRIVIALALIGIGAVALNLGEVWVPKQLEASNSFQVAEASEVAPFEGLSVEQLETKLDALVWMEESKNHVMKEGEIFQTFDPPQSWVDDGTVVSKCFKRGGKVNQECYSNGPRQTKLPTLIGKWKELHGVEITEKEARDIAEGNESSRRFFLDCAIKVKGCAKLWTGFRKHEAEGQLYINLIREAKGIKID